MDFQDRIAFFIQANADQAIGELKKVGLVTKESMAEAEGASGKFSAAFSGSSLLIKAAAGAAALGIAEMAVKGAKDFVALTAEVRGYQRTLGGTAESNSVLAAQMRMLGVDSATAEKSFGMLAKRIGEGQDTLSQWGVTVARDKNGNVDMQKTLLNMGDAYKSIQDPTQRAAFASEQLGRGYQALAPFLGKSREELKAFGEEAAKNHMVFDQSQLDKGREMGLTMKQMKEAVQGLFLALGEDLVPMMTTLTKGLTAVIGTMDKFGTAIGAGNISIVAMGASIGAMVGGPMGALAGAGTGLVAMLATMQHGWQVNTEGLKKFADEISGVNVDTAVAKFKQLQNLKLPDWAMGNASLKVFHELAAASPAAAQNLIDSLKGTGDSTDGYQAILDRAIKKRQEDAAAADSQSAANEKLTSTVLDVQAAVIKSLGGSLGYQQSLIDQQKAQTAYNDAVAQFGRESDQAKEAEIRLQQAHIATASAIFTLEGANQNLEATYRGNIAAVDEEIARLKFLAGQSQNNAAALQPLIDKLNEYRNGIDSVPDYKTTVLDLQTTLSGININGLTQTPPSFPGGFDGNPDTPYPLASGGIVLGPTRALIGEAGPEAVIPLSGRSGQGTTINLVLDGQMIAQVVRDDLFSIGRANGSALGRFA